MQPLPPSSRKHLLLCAIALLPSLSYGQTTAAHVITLDELVVSGTRVNSYKAERVQVGTFRDVDPVDVPLTSNVVTREVFDAQAARGLFDVLKNTAGVTRSQLSGATYDNLAVRGILVENRGNYRLNGSLPIVNLVDLPLENKERVEVLKGVSSLYYGFVPPSGIINLVTKRPTPDPLTTVTVGGTAHGAFHGALDVSRRFGAKGQLGVRVNAAAGTEDIGIDHFDGDRAFGALALDWRPSERLLVRYDIEHQRKDVSEPPAIALLAAVNGRVPLPPVPANDLNLGGSWQRYDAMATNQVLRADILLSPSWTLVAEAGHARTERNRNFSQFQNYNLATGAGNLRVTFQRNQDYENTNGRTELFGRFATGSVRHDLSIGVTANERKQDSGNAPTRDTPQNLYRPVTLAPMTAPVAWASAPSKIQDAGIYVYDRATFWDDRMQLLAGARYSEYESRTATTRYRRDDARPSVSALFKPTPRTSLYASYLEGLEESGTAPANRANAGEVLGPLVARQKEIGAKADLLAGTLVQLSFFEIERPTTFVDPATNRFTANGLARYRGAELSLSGEVAPNLSVIGSALVLDARQLNAANAATFGRRPENTSRHTLSAFAEYRVPAVKGLALSAGAFYTGPRPVDNQNQGSIGGYTTYTAGLSYRFKVSERDVTVRLVGDNLTNKNTWSTAGNGLLGVTLPRNVKMSVTTAF